MTGEPQQGTRRTGLIVAIVVAAIVVVAVAATMLFLNAGKQGLRSGGTTGTTSDGTAKVVTVDGKRYRQNGNIASILVLGSDMNNGAHHGEGLNGQADAVVVVAVDTAKDKVTCIAIPRNTMVDINLQRAGDFYGTHYLQICLAYALGQDDAESAELMSTAVSRLLYNITMDNVFVLNLAAIDDLADAVGGVEVEALEDIPYTDIKKGDSVILQGREGRVVHVGGDGDSWDSWEGGIATWYVRYRNQEDPDSPLQRQERGMQFIRAFVGKALDKAKGDPAVLSELYDIALQHSWTDLDASEFAYLASILIAGGYDSVDFVSLAGEMVYNDESEWGQFIPDKEALYQTVLDVYYEPLDS